MCGSCNYALTPLLYPDNREVNPRGPFCRSCRAIASRCSICSLPVRGLRMHCGICSHGGHRQCYREYMNLRPPEEIDMQNVSEARGRSTAVVGDVTDSRRQSAERTLQKRGNIVRVVMGYPCPSGCGHICFASSGHTNTSG